MLRFRSLGSGSSGNATLVEAQSGARTTRLLIDCGLTARQLELRLAQAGCTTAQLDAIFVTHEHADHIGSAIQVALRHGIALWMSAGTALATGAHLAGPLLRLLRDGERLALSDLELSPFTVPHDAREPLQLVVGDGNRRIGFMTDLGHVTPHVLVSLAGCEAILLECNHDPRLLAESSYPPFLKRRVGGAHGHLSNAQAAEALAALAHARLHTVVAAHLSERNNRPDLAQQALAGALGCAASDIPFGTPAGTGWHACAD